MSQSLLLIANASVVVCESFKVGLRVVAARAFVGGFGAFVDIGVKQDGLVHISQLSSKYVSHPMDVVSVGDTVKVRILSIDRAKKKISLTMKI